MKDFESTAPLVRLLLFAALFASAAAFAHPGLPGHTHGFANRLAHPFSGLDHLPAMTAVGLWPVQRGGRAGCLIARGGLRPIFTA